MSYDMKSHSYAGEFRSAIARAKKVLLAAGFEWSVTSGRYSAFGGTQHTTSGVRVTRVGCSETIALHIYDQHSVSDAARDARRDMKAKALAALRAAGLPFDDRGWLACGADARRAAKEATNQAAPKPVPVDARDVERRHIEEEGFRRQALHNRKVDAASEMFAILKGIADANIDTFPSSLDEDVHAEMLAAIRAVVAKVEGA